MALADTYQEILDSLPSDWTDLELDLRVQEERYVDAASLLVTCNAQPYSRHDWHFRLIVAHHFGHGPLSLGHGRQHGQRLGHQRQRHLGQRQDHRGLRLHRREQGGRRLDRERR